MILTSRFKAKLIEQPKITRGNQLVDLGKFTIGKKYRIYAVYDTGQGFTDFLISDDEGVFRWVNISIFRAN